MEPDLMVARDLRPSCPEADEGPPDVLSWMRPEASSLRFCPYSCPMS